MVTINLFWLESINDTLRDIQDLVHYGKNDSAEVALRNLRQKIKEKAAAYGNG